jgi:glycosyltransferase involved in cell wall biosynthesis
MFSWEALEGISVGGGAAYASRLAAELVAAGHRVRLFTRLGEGQPLEETLASGVRIRRCPWDKKRSFFDEIAALNGSFFQYFQDAVRKDGEYDAVHSHEWLTIEAGLKAAAGLAARYAVSFHSTEWSRTGVWPDAGDSARIAGFERDGIAEATAVAAASHQVRQKIEQQFHPPDWKLDVVYHGVDVGRFDRIPESREAIREKYRLPLNAPVALFAGRFTPAGGGDLAAEALGMARARLPGLQAVFIGEGRLEAGMRRVAGDGAVFMSPPRRVVPPELYLAADIVLAPFRRDTNGRAVLPAWAAGKPVLTLTGTVPSEFVVDGVNGWVVADDRNAVMETIVGALSDGDRLAWMGRNGRVAAETAFSWKESAARLLNLYGRRDRLAP